MYEVLTRSLLAKASFSEEDLQKCKDHFVTKKIRKRQYVLQEGDVCNRSTFIEKVRCILILLMIKAHSM